MNLHPCPPRWLLALMLAFATAPVVSITAQTPQALPPKGGAGTAVPTGAEPSSAAPRQRLYQIRKGDVVHVTVFQEPELETTARVNENGTLTCPLVGAVKIADITPEEAVTVIERAYRDGYLVKPQVTVLVVQHKAQTVTVLGQVQRPGAYELPPDGSTTILQALGLAGGCTRLASLTRVTVKRGQELHKLDVRDMASGKDSALFEVREGDVITVPEKLF